MTDSNRIQTQSALDCGIVLREAREQAGLELQEVSQRLKMPLKVLQALEQGQWGLLGAPVFVRGQLRSYARLLKIDVEPFLQRVELETTPPPELVSHSHTPRFQRVFESMARRAVYIVITAAIAVPVWLATRPHLNGGDGQTASLDVPSALPGASGDAAASPATASSRPPAKPYVASIAPLPRPSAPALRLRLTGDSWVRITAPDGSTLEQSLLKAGEERSYAGGQVARVVLGNAGAVEVQQSGSTVDLTPYRRANVARFTVSSEGSLAPVAD
ncbi:helix-turn-helix domain-containing protein [Pseudoxanthomonas mexicana]|uniref:helix-turn-helix domain-containing protein n=1 Tax=Pseudoxanthomonas mexicana TaxID=128785 RepID=UPI00398B9CAD